MPNYIDMLGRNGFGNFRDLLKDVTLHPGMGMYLDMMGSSREVPNENYPREMLQLFSIGTVMLNDDGTAKKDAQGNTIPTYGEDVVQGFAKAFTGWTHADQNMTQAWKFYWPDAKWTVPMKPWTGRRCPQDGHWPAGRTSRTGANSANQQVVSAASRAGHQEAPAVSGRAVTEPSGGPDPGRISTTRSTTSSITPTSGRSSPGS